MRSLQSHIAGPSPRPQTLFSLCISSARQFARLFEVPTAAPGLRRAHSRATTSLARSESTVHFNDSSDHETCVAKDIDRHSRKRLTELGPPCMSTHRAILHSRVDSFFSPKGLIVSSRGWRRLCDDTPGNDAQVIRPRRGRRRHRAMRTPNSPFTSRTRSQRATFQVAKE